MSWQQVDLGTAAGQTGWAGLWSALFTAERAVIALVQVTSIAESLDLIWLADELADARDDVTRRHGAALTDSFAHDLGPIPPDVGPDAARALVARVPVRTLYHLAETEPIPCRRLGNVILLPVTWVEAEAPHPRRR